jgi:hypothetical protein
MLVGRFVGSLTGFIVGSFTGVDVFICLLTCDTVTNTSFAVGLAVLFGLKVLIASEVLTGFAVMGSAAVDTHNPHVTGQTLP